MDTTEALTAAYVACFEEVIAHYTGETPTATPLTAQESGPSLAAVVGFGDEQVRGSSVLVANATAIAGLSPVGVTDARDWLGELNNQVVGRLKNRLVGFGLFVQMSTPMTATGTGMDFAAPRGNSFRWQVSWSGGRVAGLLGLTVPPELVLTAGEASVAEEGSIALF